VTNFLKITRRLDKAIEEALKIKEADVRNAIILSLVKQCLSLLPKNLGKEVAKNYFDNS